jgi:hypothetical protein
MDDEGRPVKLWARLLFQPREHSVLEWRLGLVVVGIALFLAWLILWTFIPRLIADVAIGIVSTLSWIASLFSGGGATEVATQVATPAAAPVLSPVPSPLASPSPSPSPFPR